MEMKSKGELRNKFHLVPSKSMVILICGFVATFLAQGGDAGKTLKLPHYDVTFGKWPLMEVKKTGTLFKHGKGGRGGRHYGGKGGGRVPPPHHGPSSYGPPSHGPPSHGPPSHGPPRRPPGPGPRGPKGFRIGPISTPGNLGLRNSEILNSARANRGTIHKHLQETLKMYAESKKPINSPSLPIIVKAPGPNAPPAPPGYKLGPPSVAPPNSGSWSPGPPLPGAQPSRLVSMLHHAAYSDIFKDSVDNYIAPDYNAGPPPSGTYTSVLPDGTLVETLVGNDFRPIAGRLPTPVEAKPSVPPYLTVGGPLPKNYTLVYAQRQVVAIKSPDSFDKSGITNPDASEYEVGVDLGKIYEQGYGAKPPPSHPVVITKFQKRGDLKVIPEKIIQQDLPDSGLIVNTNVVYNTPNISAPIGGRKSEAFKEALRDKHKEQKHRHKEKPLDAQVKLLGRLFTKLQRLQPPKFAVPEEEADEGKYVEVGGGWGEPDEYGEWKYVAKTKVDSPIMAVQVQTWSAPEINSSDPDIVESMAEFGNHDIKFAETDELVHLMELAMKQGNSRINVRDLGSNPQEVNENLQNWVRGHLTLIREINGDLHQKGEKIASNQFKQYQTILTPPASQNGWSGEALPSDPKVGVRGFSETMSQAINKYSPPPPINKR